MPRNKIVATLGPASMNEHTMRAMALAGARVFRLNFSHANAASFAPVIQIIRKLESELGFPITAMGDLCGPKTRIGEIENSPRQVDTAERLLLGLPDERPASSDRAFIPLGIEGLLKGLQVGQPVSLSDGLLQFHITAVEKADRLYEIEAHNAGYLSSHKGIAFPGTTHPMPAMTEKDYVDLHEGLEAGIDAVALSFVQGPHDIVAIKEEIKRHDTWIPVVAKLERQNAVDSVEDILKVTDVIMVARGDLGVECPLPKLPIMQKRLIRAARHAQKPAIVATQMLLSMVKNPIPTRAEATDVANAIMDGADCVMLSEETAVGSYPVEAVRAMSDIAGEAVEYYLERLQGPYMPSKQKNPGKYLAYAACLVAQNAESRALVSHTLSGTTARLVASRRPSHPIYGLTADPHIVHHLNFCWGVEPRFLPADDRTHMRRAEAFVAQCADVAPGESVVITAGQPTPGQAQRFTNQIKVYYK